MESSFFDHITYAQTLLLQFQFKLKEFTNIKDELSWKGGQSHNREDVSDLYWS